MARKATTVTTVEQLELENKKLESLISQKLKIEEQIKSTKARITELEQISTREKLTDICSLANERGISVDDLLRAVQEGTILDIIASSSQKEETPKGETNVNATQNNNTDTYTTAPNETSPTAHTNTFSH